MSIKALFNLEKALRVSARRLFLSAEGEGRDDLALMHATARGSGVTADKPQPEGVRSASIGTKRQIGRIPSKCEYRTMQMCI